jgi:excisionase family DNA binding protein
MQWAEMCKAVLAIDPAAWKVTAQVTTQSSENDKAPEPLGFRGSDLARPRGFEPLAFGFVVRAGAIPGSTSGSQVTEIVDGRGVAGVQISQPIAGPRGRFVTPLLQGRTAEPVVFSGLLTVRAAARLLGVTPATVYGLCSRNKLPHVRVSNAIRIALGAVKET